MSASPEMISTAANMLASGWTNLERARLFLGDDESADLAVQLAEKRDPAPSFAEVGDEQAKARLVQVAVTMLTSQLADPDLLRRGFFAGRGDADELVTLAVALARKEIGSGGHQPARSEAWAQPKRRPPPILEIDHATGATIEHRPADAVALEAQPRADLTACSRSAHAFGPPDDFTGWRRCASCGAVSVTPPHGWEPAKPAPYVSPGPWQPPVTESPIP